jgi:phage terminase large subunit-like protein
MEAMEAMQTKPMDAKPKFRLTEKQVEATRLMGGEAQHVMLVGGARAAKTFNTVRAVVARALMAPGSRHAILRFRFNHVKASIVHDTFPKVMAMCFPGVEYRLDKTDWFAQLPEGSQIWFGGLDDKQRTEKILGQEYVTIFANECSQIPWASRNLAVTRLAQSVVNKVTGKPMSLKMYYDENPPSKAHWSYKLFVQKKDPDTGKPLSDPGNYAYMFMNPRDNLANLPSEYIKTLQGLPVRLRDRFLDGKFSEIAEGALWTVEMIDQWRSEALDTPDMQRIVIAVDPSGSGDKDNAANDATGIVVVGLGVDGNGYMLEDLTLKAGPKTWGNVVASAFDRWDADKVVAEKNYGGEMVKHVIQTARPRTPYKHVVASRGKAVRAQPISALTEQGRVRFAGNFFDLEDELCAFTENGYLGDKSPNRADAFVWGMSELFPGIVKEKVVNKSSERPMFLAGNTAWMS